MKKIFTLLASLLGFYLSYAQPVLAEDFSYTSGEALTANNWTQIGTVATNPISVSTPGLTYTGYAGSGIGNAATLVTSGQDIYRDGTVSISDGSVYVSFMLNVATAQATGDYFFALLPTSSTSNFTARTFVKSSGSGYVMGVSKSTETVAYGATELSFNTTYLVVVKYTFITATTNDDAITLYVLSSGVPSTEPLTPYAGPTVGTATDATSLGRVALRQGSASNAAGLTVDGFRMGNSWDEGPLPLSLLSFTATMNDKSINLRWLTANEVNVASFDVERSINGKEFKAVATIEAKNGAATNNYTFVDNNPVAGVSYYRLKMNDKDGSFKYSSVEMVKTKAIGVSVYPNPVRSSINIQHEVAAKGAVISVINMNGKQVSSMNVETGAVQTTINAAQLAPGSYMVVYTNNGVRQTKQFIKE